MIALLLSVAISTPNPNLTPGVVDPNATVQKLCTPGYTASIRHVSDATKTEVFRRYGIPRDGEKYECDHWISLEIGGLNDISNLWPQNWPDARRKDVVETWLHRQICQGKMTIQQAQEKIKTWPAIYDSINSLKH